jgi:hypothetical protein
MPPARWYDVLLRACIVPASALGRAAEPNLGSLSWQATNDRRPTTATISPDARASSDPPLYYSACDCPHISLETNQQVKSSRDIIDSQTSLRSPHRHDALTLHHLTPSLTPSLPLHQLSLTPSRRRTCQPSPCKSTPPRSPSTCSACSSTSPRPISSRLISSCPGFPRGCPTNSAAPAD